MPNSFPLITAGITCYNASDTIERAIASALNQDWPNLEVLVVDDHSSDGSLDIIRALADVEPRLRVVPHQQNRGVGAARNTLVENALGDFLAFFDDDDYSAPNRVRQQYERITAYEQSVGTHLVACYTARNQRFPHGRQHYEPTMGMDVTPGPHGEGIADLILLGKPVLGERGACASCSMMASRALFEHMNGFDPKLRREEDTEFNLRLALAGGHFAGLSAPLVTQVMTFSDDKDYIEERRNALYLLTKYQDYLEGKSWFGFLHRWVNIKFEFLSGNFLDLLLNLPLLMFRYPLKTLQRLSWALPNLRQYLRARSNAQAARAVEGNETQ